MGNAQGYETHPGSLGENGSFVIFDESDTEEENDDRKVPVKKEPSEAKIFEFKVGDSSNVEDFIGIEAVGISEDEIEEDDTKLVGKKSHLRNVLEVEKVVPLPPGTPSVVFPKDELRFLSKDPKAMKVKSEFEGHEGAVKTLIYFPALNKMVSHSHNMRIWKVKGTFLSPSGNTHVIRAKEGIKHMIKWNEEEFIFCDGRGMIDSFNIKEEKIVKRFVSEPLQAYTVRLLRLSNERFLSMNTEGNIYRHTYSSKYLKMLSMGPNEKTTGLEDIRMLRSKKEVGCIFFNCKNLRIPGPYNHEVRMLDVVKDEIKMKFTGHAPICALETFMNKKGSEILVIGTIRHGVYMINTKNSQTHFIPQKSSIGHPTSLFVYYDRYILVGSSNGHLNLYDVKKNYLAEHVHDQKINDIKFYYYMEHDRNRFLTENDCLRLFTASDDRKIKAVELKLQERKNMPGEK